VVVVVVGSGGGAGAAVVVVEVTAAAEAGVVGTVAAEADSPRAFVERSTAGEHATVTAAMRAAQLQIHRRTRS
jgi:hypothetical protein